MLLNLECNAIYSDFILFRMNVFRRLYGLLMRLMKSIWILDSAPVLFFREKQKVVRMYSCPETEERKYLSNSDAFTVIWTDCKWPVFPVFRELFKYLIVWSSRLSLHNVHLPRVNCCVAGLFWNNVEVYLWYLGTICEWHKCIDHI